MVMADGTRVDGIGVMDHYTINMHEHKLTTLKDERLTGNIVIKNNETGETYHGFENHQGRTFLGESERALGTVVSGNGNNGMDQHRRCYLPQCLRLIFPWTDFHTQR